MIGLSSATGSFEKTKATLSFNNGNKALRFGSAYIDKILKDNYIYVGFLLSEPFVLFSFWDFDS